MVVDTLIPTLQKLDRVSKWKVLQLLMTELAREEESLYLPSGEYQIWSQYNAYSAAEALTTALNVEKASAASGVETDNG